MDEIHHFVKVDFYHFKAFDRFSLNLHHFNILVGPNNSGKSTILAAFRVLAIALRKAYARRPELVPTPLGHDYGYSIDLSGVSVAEENIFYNYDDSIPASISFTLSNKNKLKLYFPEIGSCFLLAETVGALPRTKTAFCKAFNCPIGFVPILGPVEHNEPLYQPEAARLALTSYSAARNFRNIWYYFSERFEEFRRMLSDTWPNMDIEPPQTDYTYTKPRLHMFCQEERITREIFWSGFGFQVWCQMLTHLVQSREKALFLIDEPDIYLHADLQRQLIDLLRNLGPDILIATHSTEIITESEVDDILLINKKRKMARRIKQPSELEVVFGLLGSNLNPILTQLAKTRRALFVEGKDFQILSKFAKKLNYTKIANRTEFAIVPVEGFNPERIRSLKNGIETTLGGKIAAAAILDRDYRSLAECEKISNACKVFCNVVHIHDCKEIENFLLSPNAIDRAAAKKVEERTKRYGSEETFIPCARSILDKFANDKKTHIISQYLAFRRWFQKTISSSIDEATVNKEVLSEFESRWSDSDMRLAIIPGKEALSTVNMHLQEKYRISISTAVIINAMTIDEVPQEICEIVKMLDKFSQLRPGLC